MKGYKIRQSTIFGDTRAAVLRVFINLDLYEELVEDSEKWFREDEDIMEMGLYLCWDNEAGLVTEACLLGLWSREGSKP